MIVGSMEAVKSGCRRGSHLRTAPYTVAISKERNRNMSRVNGWNDAGHDHWHPVVGRLQNPQHLVPNLLYRKEPPEKPSGLEVGTHRDRNNPTKTGCRKRLDRIVCAAR